MSSCKTMGIVGGVGPFAGSDLANKIFLETAAVRDQDHLPLIMISTPHLIEDRTNYLKNKSLENPGIAIARVIHQLVNGGAEVIGIPCNSAHASYIFNKILEDIQPIQKRICLLHMIQEVANFIASSEGSIERVGLLGTLGTYHSEVYSQHLEKKGVQTIVPSIEDQKKVHQTVYDPNFGIKAKGIPITREAGEILFKISQELIEHGAQAIILGCTEFALALKAGDLGDTLLVDTTRVLARAMIREACPEKLRLV